VRVPDALAALRSAAAQRRFLTQVTATVRDAAVDTDPLARRGLGYAFRDRPRPKAEVRRYREARRDLGKVIYAQHAAALQRVLDALPRGMPAQMRRDARHHQDTVLLPDGSEVSVRTVRRGGVGEVRWVTTSKFLDIHDHVASLIDQRTLVVDVRP
jgi:hypothetical protein